MAEVFKPRENMVYVESHRVWVRTDKNGGYTCEDGGPSLIYENGSWAFLSRMRADEGRTKSAYGLHRFDGPANSDGEWYIYGENVTEDIHEFAEENSINLDNLSDEDKVMIALKFS